MTNTPSKCQHLEHRDVLRDYNRRVASDTARVSIVKLRDALERNFAEAGVYVLSETDAPFEQVGRGVPIEPTAPGAMRPEAEIRNGLRVVYTRRALTAKMIEEAWVYVGESKNNDLGAYYDYAVSGGVDTFSAVYFEVYSKAKMAVFTKMEEYEGHLLSPEYVDDEDVKAYEVVRLMAFASSKPELVSEDIADGVGAGLNVAVGIAEVMYNQLREREGLDPEKLKRSFTVENIYTLIHTLASTPVTRLVDMEQHSFNHSPRLLYLGIDIDRPCFNPSHFRIIETDDCYRIVPSEELIAFGEGVGKREWYTGRCPAASANARNHKTVLYDFTDWVCTLVREKILA